MQKQNTDVTIIGGGAAGIMAAITLKRKYPDKQVILTDRTFALGRKILVCGAGRCNITNVNLENGPQGHYYGAEASFVSAVMERFAYEDIVNFFADLGVEVYVELKRSIGKLFPVTNRADTITEMLIDELNRLGVKVWLNSEVTGITPADEGFDIQLSHTVREQSLTLRSTVCILAAGGKTYPALGSNGSGYDLAESLGHTIIEPVPSALPVEAENELSDKLQGIRVEMEATAVIEGKDGKQSTDEVMFTKYGLSGPAILNISREISIHINRHGGSSAGIRLNAFPGLSEDNVIELLEKRWTKRPDQLVNVSMYGLFPNKVADVFSELAGLPDRTSGSLTPAEKKEACRNNDRVHNSCYSNPHME
ncbi:MAG: tricarballylate dehydrogenase [candidate division WS6 bacterium OLB20]|uniref:Tricarballylate dehydrogenase n=1 Tax=candidate division WS6 bacterium OLB20 TaxID=1617426 RepID=A0A136M088_9BACT|nr:MAG: tricarballylate dehydrogenase [candidate division WS6 bacterium OLB20]